MVLRSLSLLLFALVLGACDREDARIIGPGMGYDPGGTVQPATPHHASEHYVPTSYNY